MSSKIHTNNVFIGFNGRNYELVCEYNGSDILYVIGKIYKKYYDYEHFLCLTTDVYSNGETFTSSKIFYKG